MRFEVNEIGTTMWLRRFRPDQFGSRINDEKDTESERAGFEFSVRYLADSGKN